MDIGDFLSDLVSEAKARTKNKIVSTVVVTWIFTNYNHFINIAFSSNRTPEFVNSEIELSIFNLTNLLLIPCIFTLYVYFLPKANFKLKSFLHHKFELKEVKKDINEKIDIEKEKRRFLDVRSGNKQLQELQSEIERLEALRDEANANTDKLITKLETSEKNASSKTKELEDLHQREKIVISWFGIDGYDSLLSKGIMPNSALKKSAAAIMKLIDDKKI